MDIEILLEGEGLADLETIRVPHGSTARDIVAVIANRTGFAPEEGHLFVEDCDEPLDLAVVVIEEHPERPIHHVHRLRTIDVRVFYQGRHLDKHFAPSTRVRRVLDWAVGNNGFKIDPTIAPEMELALHGAITALPKDAHLGRFLRHPHHELQLDLIRGIVPNGAGA